MTVTGNNKKLSYRAHSNSRSPSTI